MCKKLTIVLSLILSLNTAWSSKPAGPDDSDFPSTTTTSSYLSGVSSFVIDNVKNVANHLSKHPLESLALSSSLALHYMPVDEYLGEGATSLLSLSLAGAPIVLGVIKDSTLSVGSKVLFLAGGLLLTDAVPAAAAAVYGAEICALPGGSYLGSCHDAAVQPYVSTDPNVPDSCVLSAMCDATHTAIARTPNTLHYAAGEDFTLGNNNGTLVVQSVGGGGTHLASSLGTVDCHPLPGSFSETCTVESVPYASSDANLAGAHLCEMTTDCATLKGTRTSSAVHYAHQGVTTVVENCDGTPVLHPDSTHDHQCSHVSAKAIEAIAEQH